MDGVRSVCAQPTPEKPNDGMFANLWGQIHEADSWNVCGILLPEFFTVAAAGCPDGYLILGCLLGIW